MTDEFKLNRAAARKAQAEALLRNELLQEAFTSIDAAYVDAWRGCPDPVAREQLWMAQSNLRKVKAHLTKTINDGKLAEHEIQDLTARRKMTERAIA